MAELYEEVVVCPNDAIRKTSEALSLVDGIRSDLEMEAQRLAVGTSSSASIDDVIKRDPLIHALHRSSRHITRLRETLSAQANIPLEDYWLDGRHTMIVFEKCKAESSLYAAQTAANNSYQVVLMEIRNRIDPGSSCHAEMQSKVQMCDHVCAATATALSAVTEGLCGFPATISRRRRRFERVAAGASVGEGVGLEQSARERIHREAFSERPIFSPRRESVAVRAAVYDGDLLGGDRDLDPRRSARAARRNSRKKPAVGRREEAEVIDLTEPDTSASGCGGATAAAANALPGHFESSLPPAAVPADEWRITRRPAPGPSPTAATAVMTADEWRITSRTAPGPSPTAAAAAVVEAADEWRVSPRPAPGPSPAAADERRVNPRPAPGSSPTAAAAAAAAVDEWLVTPRPAPVPTPSAAAAGAAADERRVNPRPAASSPQTMAAAAAAADDRKVTPRSAHGARGRRANGHPTAAVDERRRLMARASPDRFGARSEDGGACAGGLDCTCSGGWVDAYAGGLNRAREMGSAKEAPPSRINRKPTAAEQYAASVNLTQGRSAMVPRRRNRQASERESTTVTVPTDRPARRVAARTSDRHSSPPPLSPMPLSLTVARAGGSGREREDGGRLGDLRNHLAVDNSELLGDDVVQAILDDSDLVSLLSDTRSPRLSGEATRARRRSLVRMHSMGDGMNLTPVLRRSHSIGRSSHRSRPSQEELSPSSGEVARIGTSGRDGDASYDVHEDEAAAHRLFREEKEERIRQDELMAHQLAAREEAGVDRILSRHPRHYRRAHRHSPGTSYVLNPAAAAAVATGDEVSDAVRALQFQEIDENDFDTLLTLDEQGGVGGRNCAGGRGLNEDVLDGLLRACTVMATGEEDFCSICLSGYQMGKEITILPCGHAFHPGCIRKSLLNNNRCPVDMKPVVPESPNSG